MKHPCPCCQRELEFSPPTGGGEGESMGNLLSCSRCGSTLKFDDQNTFTVVYDNSASLEMDSSPSPDSPAREEEAQNPGEAAPKGDAPLKDPAPGEDPLSSGGSSPPTLEAEGVEEPSFEQGEEASVLASKEQNSGDEGGASPGEGVPDPEESPQTLEEDPAGEDSHPLDSSPAGTEEQVVDSSPALPEEPSPEQESPPPSGETDSSLEGEESKSPSPGGGRDREGSIITPPPMGQDREEDQKEVSEQEKGEDVLAPSGDQGFEDVAEFGNSPDSPDKGFLLYDLQIQGIDSQELKEELLSVLEDPRLNWDGREILSGIKSGVLEIKKLNPVKMFCLISALCDLPFRLSWRQYTVLDVTSPEKGEEADFSDPGLAEDSSDNPQAPAEET